MPIWACSVIAISVERTQAHKPKASRVEGHIYTKITKDKVKQVF